MTRVEHMIAIGPPIDGAFDFMTDPVWLSSVRNVDDPERPIAFRCEVVAVIWRATEQVPPVRSAAERGTESS